MKGSDTRNCPFCHVPVQAIVAQNDDAFTIRDRYPVSTGHTLVVPMRHVASFFNLNHDELRAIMALVVEAKEICDKQFHPDGYNVGVNVGTAAGQTVMHAHVHVIPRYEGDMPDPTGGVRHVIPGRGKYPIGTSNG